MAQRVRGSLLNDKLDVTICYYRSEKLWPYVAWGLKQNQDQIGTVIVSNDEPWGDSSREALRIVAEDAKLTVPIKYIEHPRTGMRQAQSINDGVRAATSEYVLQIDDDVVLAPGCVREFLSVAESGILLTGRLHDIPRGDFPLTRLGNPEILKQDQRKITTELGHDLVFQVRDSFLCYNKDDYWSVGGHDESIHDGTEAGYGFIDYVFAIRWFKKFGLDSLEMTPASGYHLSGLKPGHDFSRVNQSRFEAAFMDFVLAGANV